MEHATKENAQRFTIGKITCTVSKAKHEGNSDELILSHDDYDFNCLISSHSLAEWKPKETSGIFIDHKSKDEILNNLGLNFKQGYTIRDNVNSTRKYGDNKNVETPKKVNLRTVNSSRFETFANNWFEFLNIVEWVEWCKESKQMQETINVSTTRITDLINATTHSDKVLYERETTVRNKFCRMTYRDDKPSTQVEVTTYTMTEEQKVELFKFLDTMSKPKTKN